MSTELLSLSALVPGITIAPTSLIMPPQATIAHFEAAFKACWSARDTVQMWMADLLNQADERFGEGWVQVCASVVGRSMYTVENWRSVYRHVPPHARMPGVAHSKHVEVAVLRSPALQHRILEVARDNELPTEDVRKIVAQFKEEEVSIQRQFASMVDAGFLELLQESVADDDDIPFSDPYSPLYSEGGVERDVCPHCGGRLT